MVRLERFRVGVEAGGNWEIFFFKKKGKKNYITYIAYSRTELMQYLAFLRMHLERGSEGVFRGEQGTWCIGEFNSGTSSIHDNRW